MLIDYKLGQGSIVLRVKILNSSVATGAGLTGLTSASSGLVIAAIADNEASSVSYSGSNLETITTLGTYAAPTSGKARFKEVDSTNHKGIYEIQLADARYAVSSAKSVLISISGATNAAETDVLIPLRTIDPYSTSFGITGNVPADLQTVKTQSVTCSAGVTVSPYVGSTGAAINGTNANTLSSHDPGATIGTSTLTQAQVTGGAYSVQSSSCVLGDARIANLDAAVSTRGTSTLTQAQITGGAYALNNASFAFNAALPLTTQQKADVNAEADTAASDYGALKPTTAGRTLDVSVGGEAGIDWANVGSPTTSVGLSGTTVKTATDVEADTQDIQSRLPAALVSGRMDSNVQAMANNVITAAVVADAAIDAATFAEDVDAEILSYIVDDATRVDASALNTLSGHDPGATIGTSTYAGADTSGTTTLLSRLTSSRAGYLDNLNIGGSVASSSEVTSIQNNTTTSLIAPANIIRPTSGTTDVKILVYLTDEVGNMEAPDSAPTLSVFNAAGDDLSSRLASTTGTLVSTGVYTWTYTSSSTDDAEEILFTVTVVEGGATRLKGTTSWITDNASTDFTSSDRSKLEALYGKLPSKNYLAGTSNSDGDIQLDEATGTVARVTLADTVTDVTNLHASAATAASQTTILNRLGAFTGSGINTVLGFFKSLLSKVAGTPSDIGGTFDPATDSVEAISESVDAGGVTAEAIWSHPDRTLTAADNITSDGETVDQTKIAHLDADITSRMATYTQPTGFLAATFPTTVASTTNITAASGVSLAANQHVIVDSGTVTNLTNLPAITNNWLTAAGIASAALNGKGDWSTVNADNSSITAIKAKTDNLPSSPAAIGSAMTLTSAYDAAKTAATQASVDDLPTNSELATALAAADDATLAAISALGSPMQAGSTVVLTDGSLTTAKLGTFALAKGTNITGFNDIAAGAAMTLTGAYDFAKGNVAMTESYRSTGASPTPSQALFEVLQNIIQFSVDEDAKTKTAYKLDGVTVAKRYTLDAIPPTAITEDL